MSTKQTLYYGVFTHPLPNHCPIRLNYSHELQWFSYSLDVQYVKTIQISLYHQLNFRFMLHPPSLNPPPIPHVICIWSLEICSCGGSLYSAVGQVRNPVEVCLMRKFCLGYHTQKLVLAWVLKVSEHVNSQHKSLKEMNPSHQTDHKPTDK